MKIEAIVAVRNEEPYLEALVPYLAEENVQIVLIDNDSVDGTRDLFTPNRYSNIIEVVHLPFNGVFDLTAQLEAKLVASARSTADWLIHQDADEILQSPTGWGGLRQSIEDADAAGFNALNFDELVMLPVDPAVDDILHNNSNYYFFEPSPLRLMRCWRRTSKLRNTESGGHILAGGDLRVSPKRMILKHFIVRSQRHAFQKYLGRTFSGRDISKGWHKNRLSFTEGNLKIPKCNAYLHELAEPKSTPELLPSPVTTHFWDWSAMENGVMHVGGRS